MTQNVLHEPESARRKIASDVTLGRDVEIRDWVSISGSQIGDGCLIGSHVEIHNGAVLGEDVKVYGFVNLYGCTVGDGSQFGAFVEVQKNAHIGSHCKISSHSFVCEGVTIEDRVFVGHGVRFINDRVPRATNGDGTLKSGDDWQVIETRVCSDVGIGSGAVIMCGVTIGENALVGAGSVVTKDVPPGEVWAGNPAKFMKKTEDA